MSKITKVVIALGGNALEDKSMPSTAEAQLEVVNKTCEYLADISCAGYEIVIVHGNGPQVGRILLASETAKDITPPMPFDVCGAMSQGYIGYHIQQGLKYALAKRNKVLPVVTLVTQVVVDKQDTAFSNPTKPIGPFYSEEEAKKLADEKGYIVKEDAGRGWRRVVPSPIPKEILEVGTVKSLWDTTITIACGGGGIPVIKNENGSVEGIAAVIDKDLAAEKLSEDIDADILLILTEVEKVSLNFNSPNQKDLSHITVGEAEKYIEEGHFAPGSMLPKVTACVKFAKSKLGRKAIITSLYKSMEALEGKTGTIIES
ncbi:carbamate kinase [Sedimentibacter sp. MB31-C6]|uniref:carbamate kinase n=1 Tax=Sedimentibacter sp. MB31-C6 TaxID=3109366 RepID=UPI002DDC9E33|nr:carbamate kinase [Sedimentibacter sp. MB36-C1]WSI05316.1 carbamate kinase [Sedimentibacter sp. MB36-C1]